MEQFSTNKMCVNCPHKAPCAKLMGPRLGKITLDHLKVNMIPQGFNVDIPEERAEIGSIEIIYQECYSAVFGKPTKQSIGNKASDIARLADLAGTSIRMYILTLMVAHAENDEKGMIQFTPYHLVGDGRVKTVGMYKKVCCKKFASFADKDLEILTGVHFGESTPYTKIADTELLVGEFIVGYKRRHEGYPTDVLYSRRELALDPLWLATEETYREDILAKFIPEPYGTEAERRHRFRVLQCLQQMKRRKPYAISVFAARSAAVVNVLPTVLSRFGLQTTDLETVNKDVTDSINLWYQIGVCLQQLECLKFTWGMPNVFFC